VGFPIGLQPCLARFLLHSNTLRDNQAKANKKASVSDKLSGGKIGILVRKGRAESGKQIAAVLL
jgi:hypothetical protein